MGEDLQTNVIVFLEPRPTEFHRLSEDLVEVHRNLHCFHYDSCLDVAVRSGWASWTCVRCPLRAVKSEVPRVQDFAQDRRRDTGTL